MLVFWKERLSFLSVPKTGTTAFHKALAPHSDISIQDPPELKHAPLFRYDRFFQSMFEKACNVNNMQTLAVMREPIDWLGSWYRYRQRPWMQGHPNATHDISFDDFVLAYIKGSPPSFANVGSQARFLTPRPGKPPVTHLFRYEDQPGLISFLKERLDVEFELTQENVSPTRTLELSPNVEKRLRNKCAHEFALWQSIPTSV